VKRSKRMTIAILTMASLTLGGSVALAHNAGHIHLPNGECVDVGSGKHGPTEHQDKDPNQPGDQHGARHAADQGKTPIYPRHCDEPGAHNHP